MTCHVIILYHDEGDEKLSLLKLFQFNYANLFFLLANRVKVDALEQEALCDAYS